MILNIESLRIIWWVLLGVLFSGFAIMDGFDLGVAAMLPFVGRKDIERRIIINTVGAVWEGNQVWLILAAGALFAAWPMIYAVAFSGFYFAMLMLLLTIGIIRPVAFKYRSKLVSRAWRQTWDVLLCLSGLLSPFLLGVVIGNVIQGVPFYFDQTLRIFYTGTFFALFNPFALLCGLTAVVMLLMHGGLYLAIKTEAPIQPRAARYSRVSAGLFIVLFALGGVWLAYGIKGYVVLKSLGPLAPSNPLHKIVHQQLGAWMDNYHRMPWMITAPTLGLVGALLSVIANGLRRYRLAFVLSAVAIVGVVMTVGFSLFPFLLPSVTHPNMSLIVWDASSSAPTLLIMLVATLVFMPLILFYTAWVFRVLRGKVTQEALEDHSSTAY